MNMNMNMNRNMSMTMNMHWNMNMSINKNVNINLNMNMSVKINKYLYKYENEYEYVCKTKKYCLLKIYIWCVNDICNCVLPGEKRFTCKDGANSSRCISTCCKCFSIRFDDRIVMFP